MNHWIEPVNVIETTKSFLAVNKGDEAAEDLIMAIACELLDVSDEKLMEMLEEKDNAEEKARVERLTAEALKSRKNQYNDFDGYFYFDQITADRNDRLDEKTVAEIIESEEPDESYHCKMDEIYTDAVEDEYEYQIREIEKDLKKQGVDTEMYHDTISEFIRERVTLNAPYYQCGEQLYNVDILMDTGDANYDYSINAGAPFDEKSGMAWLASTQGYDLETLNWAMESKDESEIGSKFLRSAFVETRECPSDCPAVCFMVKMKLSTLIRLNELINRQKLQDDCGKLRIGAKTRTGLYDFMSGGGSLMEMELEKDIDIPIKYIRSATPDVNGCQGMNWSIGETYGFCSSAWTETVGEIYEP